MRSWVVAAALGLASFVSACSNDGEATAQTALETVQDYVVAVVDGDAETACELETEAYASGQNDIIGFYREGDSPDCAGRIDAWDQAVEGDGIDFADYVAAVHAADFEVVYSSDEEVVVRVSYPGTEVSPDVYGLQYDGRWRIAEGASALLPEFEQG